MDQVLQASVQAQVLFLTVLNARCEVFLQLFFFSFSAKYLLNASVRTNKFVLIG